MGGGSYNLNVSKLRSTSLYAGASLDSISDLKTSGFFEDNLHESLNPRNVIVRESRDSIEHPNSVAILFGLDVTGSMGAIPGYMLKKGLNNSIELLFKCGIKDPQLGIIAIGDVKSDKAPLQISQFESSDELIDKCLRNIYPEGAGGGNYGESYNLAWYHGAFHTDIDCLNKRGQKGLLITIGDEACHNELNGEAIKQLYNLSEIPKNYSNEELLEKVREKYVIKHIHISSTHQGSSTSNQKFWKDLLGEDVFMLDNHEKIHEVLEKIISDFSKTISIDENVSILDNTVTDSNVSTNNSQMENTWD